MPPASTSSAGRYVKEAELGSGTYGVVYMAKDRLTGGTVAIKRMNVSTEDEGVPATTIREVCLLKELQHPNIVRLTDVTFQAPKLTLVFEYCEYDLKKYMDAKKPLDIHGEVKCLLKQLLLGLDYMHQKSVVHRDLKPQNLLLNSNLQLKIADLGLARVDGIPVKKYSHEAVTLWYRSPDVILGSTNYGFAVDMWSVGCIFAEMIVGKPLFNGHSDAEQLGKIYKLLGSPTRANFPNLTHYPSYKTVYAASKDNVLTEVTFPSTFNDFVRSTDLSKLDAGGVDLLRQMLAYDPAQRITAAQALQHPFLKDYEVQYVVPAEAAPAGSPTFPRGSTAGMNTAAAAAPAPSVASSGAAGKTVVLRQDPTLLMQMQNALDNIDAALRHAAQSESQHEYLNSVSAANQSVGLNASSKMIPIPPSSNPRSTISFAPHK